MPPGLPNARPLPLLSERPTGDAPITLSVEEYEAIRLMDHLGLNQEGRRPDGRGGPRSSGFYAQARQKLAAFWWRAVPRKSAAAAMLFAPAGRRSCGRGSAGAIRKTERMQSCENRGHLRQRQCIRHFGHTEQFKIYEVVDGMLANAQICPTNGSGHGALAGFLASRGVDALICGGIGAGAQTALAEAGIRLYAGCSGSADQRVAELLAGTLVYAQAATCDHHHGEEHTCGDHGCGEHGCQH